MKYFKLRKEEVFWYSVFIVLFSFIGFLRGLFWSSLSFSIGGIMLGRIIVYLEDKYQKRNNGEIKK